MYNNIQCCHWEIGNKEGDFIVEISNFSKIKIRFLPGDTKSGWIHGPCQKHQCLGALDLYQIIMCFWQGNIQLTQVISRKATEKEYRECGGATSWPMTPFNSQRYVVLLNHALKLISTLIRVANLTKIIHQIVTISAWKLCRHYGTVCTIMYTLWRH